MVRFHWNVDGTNTAAWVSAGGISQEDKGVRHVTISMEVRQLALGRRGCSRFKLHTCAIDKQQQALPIVAIAVGHLDQSSLAGAPAAAGGPERDGDEHADPSR